MQPQSFLHSARHLILLGVILYHALSCSTTPVRLKRPSHAGHLKTASSNNVEFTPFDFIRDGRCRAPKPMSRSRPPTSMHWLRCRQQSGVGWKYGVRCFGMAGALALLEPSPDGLCYFREDGWVLPPPGPNFPVVLPGDPRPKFDTPFTDHSAQQKHDVASG